ncbi:MAG: ECF transporter S component [Deltaproteobacteria bacterium]|nr:ECF transporter S component [Deltaproteobacteria bacterium]
MNASQITATYDLKFTSIKLYMIVAIFVALDVAIPWAFHTIHPMAGPTFLPMFFFILLAGLLFGWRAGILVGLVTPLVSHGLCGMPVAAILPRVIIEGAMYGLAAGLLYEKFGCRIFWATLGAIILGRLATVIVLFIIYAGSINPAAMVWKAVKIGWPGIISQVVMVPLIAVLVQRIIAGIRDTDGSH